MNSVYSRLIELSRCRPGSGTFVEFDGRELAVFLLDNGRVEVIDNACPHASGNLSGGQVDQGVVTCPWHEWRFDLASGECANSSRARVRRYEATIRNGWVWAILGGETVTESVRRSRSGDSNSIQRGSADMNDRIKVRGIASSLATQLEDTRDWTLKLLADLKGADWTFQPAPGLAHALWLCGHLASSQNILVHIRCLGKSGLLDEKFTNHFAIGGQVKSAEEHDYPSVGTVLSTMKMVHAETLNVVRGMSDDLLAEPAYAADGKSLHPHYRDKAGAVAHCNRHEAFHAGQIALIRRLLGRSFLR